MSVDAVVQAYADTLYFTELRARFAVAFAERYADALIEIATDFVGWDWDDKEDGYNSCCRHCTKSVFEGCADRCPGLAARRALGVA